MSIIYGILILCFDFYLYTRCLSSFRNLFKLMDNLWCKYFCWNSKAKCSMDSCQFDYYISIFSESSQNMSDPRLSNPQREVAHHSQEVEC